MASRHIKLKKAADVRTLSKDVWIIEKEGVSRARSQRTRTDGHYATQAQAETVAREAPKRSGGGEVIVHRRDGHIRDSDTISGHDEHPAQRDTKR